MSMSAVKKIFLGVFSVVLVFLVSACSGKSGSGKAVPDYAYREEAVADIAFSKAPAMARNSGAVYGTTQNTVAVRGGAGFENTGSDYEKKIIKTGYIELEVGGLEEAEASIEKWCKDFGGYISSSSMGKSSLSITAHVPSDKFDEALEIAGGLGDLKNKNVSSRDVTEDFYDLASRLENKKILRDRLKGYLQTAKNIQDLLQIENQLNGVLSDIDSMEGSLKRLTGQIDYSQIQITASLPSYTQEGGFKWPSWTDAFIDFALVIVRFFKNFVFLIFYIVIIGIPVVLLSGGLYYLTFGKLGLVKKFFRKLSGKPKKEE